MKSKITVLKNICGCVHKIWEDKRSAIVKRKDTKICKRHTFNKED